jgi:CyaY protein
MDDATFDAVARFELSDIEDSLSQLDPDDVELSTSDGVLRIDLRDRTRIVVNAHRAAKQIWMAAVSTAWHFDAAPNGQWRAARTDEELRTTLVKVIHERIGLVVSLPPSPVRRQATDATAALLQVVRLWAAIAWADGRVAPSEGDALRRVIHAAGFDEATRMTAHGFLDHKVELSEVLDGISAAARPGVYRIACKMANVDGIVAPMERAALDRLAVSLKMLSEEARQIEFQEFAH